MNLNACIKLDQRALKGLWTKPQWEKELSDPKRICLGVIDVETKKLIGLCSAWSVIDELHITSIAIDPTHKRKGLGKSLLTNLIKHSNTHKNNKVYLEVKNTNETAKAFYKAMGFKIVGKRSHLYKDGSDAIIFTKKIN